jgi:hypothetical protein
MHFPEGCRVTLCPCDAYGTETASEVPPVQRVKMFLAAARITLQHALLAWKTPT